MCLIYFLEFALRPGVTGHRPVSGQLVSLTFATYAEVDVVLERKGLE